MRLNLCFRPFTSVIKQRCSSLAVIALIQFIVHDAFGFTIGDRVMAVGDIVVRYAPPNLSRIPGSDKPYDQYRGVHGTIIDGPLTGTTPDTDNYDTWWEITWDAGIDGWSAQSVITNAPLTGDVPEPNFSGSFYTTNNIFWQSGNAPASTGPPTSNLGSALGNCTWYACGRMLELGYNATQLNTLNSNANEWHDEAIAAGIAVDTTPTLHSIAQSTNSPWNILWRHRTCLPSWFDCFIHVSLASPSNTIGIGPILSNPIVNQGAMAFTISGPAGSNAILQSSFDLVNWSSISTSAIPTSGSLSFTNAILSNTPQQFFRELLY